MATEKTTTLADNDVGKVTAIPQDASLLLVDEQGGVTKIDTERLMELFRESIQIGGRNLVKNTSGYKISATGSVWLSSWLTINTADILDREDMLIFSCKYRKTSAVASGNVALGVSVANSWYEQAVFKAENLAEAGVLSKSLDVKAQRGVWDRFSPFVLGVDGIELYDIKLERGNIATDWTPAPEDLIGGGNLLVCKELQSLKFATSPKTATKKMRPRRKISVFNFNLN